VTSARCHYGTCREPATHDALIHRTYVLDDRGHRTYDQNRGGMPITKPAKTRVTPGGYFCRPHARVIADSSTKKEKRRG